jgi:hypothetical protein
MQKLGANSLADVVRLMERLRALDRIPMSGSAANNSR